MKKYPMSAKARARLGGLACQRLEGDAAAARARAGFEARFAKLADPDGVLSDEERARRAALLRKEYFVRIAAQSAQKRAKRQSRTQRGGVR